MSDKRFIIRYTEGSEWKVKFRIIVDTVTGVNYMLVGNGYGYGVTPLLDREGKPIIDEYRE